MRLGNWLKNCLYEDYHNIILWVIAFYAFGCAYYFCLANEPSLKLLLLVSVLVFVITILAIRLATKSKFFIISLFFFSFIIGVLVSYCKTHIISTPMLKNSINSVWIKGTVDQVYPLESGKRLILKNIKIYSHQQLIKTSLKKIQITAKTNTDCNIGDYIGLFASIKPVSNPLFPGKYDFRRHAYFAGIGASGYTMSKIIILKKADNFTLFEKLELLRWKIFSYLYNEENKTAAIAIALIIGEQKAIDKKTLESMRQSGLTHILSVSGMHLSMLSMLCFILVRYILSNFIFFAQKYNVKKIAAWISLFITFSYLLISGMQIAAIRAFIMISFVIFAVIIDKTEDAKRSVCFAALIILLFNPESIFHPSFQMSFSSVLALVVSYEFLAKHLYSNKNTNFIKRIQIYFFGVGLTSLIAGSATAIFVVYHFGNYSNYSMIANLLAAPIVSFIIMPSILLTVFLLPLGLHKISLFLLEFGISNMLKIADYISNLPLSFIHFPTISFAILSLFVIGFLWLCLWQAKWRFFGIIPIIISIIALCYTAFPAIIIDAKYQTVLIKHNKNLIQIGGKNYLSHWHKELWFNISGVQSIKRVKPGTNHSINYLGNSLQLSFEDQGKKGMLLTNFRIAQGTKFIEIDKNDLEQKGSYFIYLLPKIDYQYSINYSHKRPWS